MSRSGTLLQILKDNDVRLITHEPDNVLTRLIAEDEAIGTAPQSRADPQPRSETAGRGTQRWTGILDTEQGGAPEPEAVRSRGISLLFSATGASRRYASDRVNWGRQH